MNEKPITFSDSNAIKFKVNMHTALGLSWGKKSRKLAILMKTKKEHNYRFTIQL